MFTQVFPELFILPGLKDLLDNVYTVELVDGSSYLQVIIPIEIDLEKVTLLLKGLRDRYNGEIRLIFEDQENALRFVGLVTDDDLELIHGKTTYFEVSPNNIGNFLFSFMQEFRHQFGSAKPPFYIKEADALDLADEKFVELIIQSFAWNFETRSINMDKSRKIIDAINRIIHKDFNGIFIVRDDQNRLLGSFTLIHLHDEIQLHTVAGRPANELHQTKDKLRILLFFFFSVMQNNYPGYKLTFNSSEAVEKYEKLGIPVSKRYGVVVRTKPQNAVQTSN